MTNAMRTALVAGASGLVGRALLGLLLESPRYRSVRALLRRPVPDLPAHPKLAIDVVDFGRLPALPPVDDVFIALGTTIRAAGASRLSVVSALGADSGSRVFYNRVKGEMERAVAALGYDSVVIARPSLLIGDREALGQPTRAGEQWAAGLLRPALKWVPRNVRPIRAEAVARALLRAAAEARRGTTVLSSGEMQPAD